MAEYHLECHEFCSLKPGTPMSEFISDMLAKGVSFRAIVRACDEKGYKTNMSTLARHKKHIVITAPPDPEPERPPTNIEILEAIIRKGFQNQANWRPTISDTMKAMDMWFRLTQGNPFDDLLDTLARASTGDTSAPPENARAISIPEELGDEGEEDEQ